MTETEAGLVRRRRVFYVPGFDPRAPSYYHDVYRQQAPRQGALTGVTYEVGSRRRIGKAVVAWRVTCQDARGQVETDYRLFRWDDAVRARWRRTLWQLAGDTVRSLAALIRAGAVSLMRRKSPPTFFAALFPGVVALLYIAVAVSLSIAAGVAIGSASAGWVGAGVALALLALTPTGWRWLDRTIGVCWLTRCFHYMVDSAKGLGLDDPRWPALADAVVDALRDESLDEVLVVGHSQGTVHAARAVAAVLRAYPGERRPQFSLLTLGQPFVPYAMLPDDAAFRADLALIATRPDVVWADITSPADPPSSGRVDPLHGIDLAGPRLWPVTRSPRFHTLVTPGTMWRLRLNALRFHFQYIMAGEIVGEYDYFQLTAGPLRLLQRGNGA